MSTHTISYEETYGEQGDVAFAAFCDGADCLFAGSWQHADSMPAWLRSDADTAITEAFRQAERDGVAHLLAVGD